MPCQYSASFFISAIPPLSFRYAPHHLDEDILILLHSCTLKICCLLLSLVSTELCTQYHRQENRMAENVCRRTQNLPELDSCPICWASKHSVPPPFPRKIQHYSVLMLIQQCARDPISGICRDCRAHLTRRYDGGKVVKYAPKFYDAGKSNASMYTSQS
jgi:hypothetical protein